MRCRYCGSSIPQNETRCQRCQHRLGDDAGRRFPVVDSAAAPDYDLRPEEAEPMKRRLTTVADNPNVAQRPRPATQPRLFPHDDPRRIVELREYRPAPARQRHSDHPRQPKRRTDPGQGSFDFTPAPQHTAPLSREMSRRTDLQVAGLRFRAMAAVFDAGFVFALAGLFLLAVRLCLHALPMGPVFYGCYGATALLIAGGYKFLYCWANQATLGQQGARLRIVSLDGLPPTRAQLLVRMLAGWLSLASAGMGLLWALVDQETLSWHDHISQTFLTYDD